MVFRLCDRVCTACGMRDKCQPDERTLQWWFLQVPSQTKREKIRYGAWYLDPKTWRRQKVSEPLKAPEVTINYLGNVKDRSEKVLRM